MDEEEDKDVLDALLSFLGLMAWPWVCVDAEEGVELDEDVRGCDWEEAGPGECGVRGVWGYWVRAPWTTAYTSLR